MEVDEIQRAASYAASVSAIAANMAVIRLHGLLLAKGLLTAQEIEQLRHQHLLQFDVSIETVPSAAAREAVDDDRAVLDRLWQAAVQMPRPSA